MDREKLIKYLKNVVDLEVQCKTTQKSYETCQNRLSQMGINRTYFKPVYSPPIAPSGSTGLTFLAIGLIVTVVIFIIGEAVGIIFGSIIKILCLPAIAGTIYFACDGFSSDSYSRREYESKKQIAEENYKRQLEQYNQAVHQNELQLKFDQQNMPTLKNDVQLLKKRYDSSNELLQKYYNLNVIRPKYRNLVCVTTFLEYLENERCYTLTGHEGCYNLFEEELQRGIIINQLTNISQQLGQIRKNQEYLAYALEDIQHATNHLCECVTGINGKLDMVEQDLRTQSFYAEQEANDQRRLNNYIMMRDWFNS